ncbi:MAG: hypothetical protein K6G00_05500 [Treponema sp.]|nr:hypothetical protein [Treponema sp.]
MLYKYVRYIPVFAIIFLAIAGIGCGVDSVDEYFESPKSDGHTVYWDTADRTQHYFSFYTTEADSGSEVVFLGTDVYYKIYTNPSSITSVESSVSAVSENSQLTSLKSRGYKQLKIDGSSPYPLIRSAGSNRHVVIRLTSYSSYIRQITVDSSVLGTPVRNGGSGFQFGNSPDSVPASGDSDFSGSSSSSVFYVDVYAVSVGRNTSDSTTYYSPVIHLGSVPIANPWTLN